MDYYNQLLSLSSKEELEQKIEEKIKEFHSYISREAAVTLLAKEYNIYKKETKFFKIKEIPKSSREINLKAKVASIDSTKCYHSGKCSREIILKDDSGTIPFVLWEKNVQLLDRISINDEIEILNAYEKNGKLGLSYYGRIKILNKKGFTSLNSLKEKEPLKVRGFISKIKKIKDDGYFFFSLSDGKTEINVTVKEGVDRFSSLEKNDEIMMENVFFQNNSLYADYKSRIFTRRPKNIIVGKVEKLLLKEETLQVILDGEKHIFKEDNIYTFLNTQRNEHLSLETLIKLKKDSYLGKRVFIKFKNKDIDDTIDSVSILGGEMNVKTG